MFCEPAQMVENSSSMLGMLNVISEDKPAVIPEEYLWY